MRLRLYPPAVLAAAALLCRPAAAQTLDGVLLAQDGETPLPGARVALVGLGARVAAEGRTDSAGHFQLTAPAAGLYRLRAQPEGGAAILFAPVTLAAGESKSLEVEAHPPTLADTTFALAPVTAVAEVRRRNLERHGFYQRKHIYPGRFLTHEDFMRLHGFRVVEKLTALGIGMEPHGRDRFALFIQKHTGPANAPQARCYVAVYIDGTPVSDISVSQLTNDMVAAVEYYTRDNIPPEFNPFLGDPNGRCASLAIWTQPAPPVSP
jgi:hypothetical protein